MISERVRFAGSDGREYAYVAFWGRSGAGSLSYRAAASGRRHGLTCVWVNVHPGEGGSPEVQLTSVGKDASCTDPPQPSGRAADLVKAVLGRVAALVGTRRVVLEDEADFTVDLPPEAPGMPAGHVDVVMAEHNALVHGATYYERRLGAVPRGRDTREALDALNRHRASALPSSPSALDRELARAGFADPWARGLVAEAYREAGGTWGGLYAALDAGGARARGSAAVVQRLFRHAVARAGLPAGTRLRGAVWEVPRTAVRSWKALVLEVATLDDGTATRRSRTAATAAATAAAAAATRASTLRGGGGASAGAPAAVARAFAHLRARRASVARWL